MMKQKVRLIEIIVTGEKRYVTIDQLNQIIERGIKYKELGKEIEV